MASYVMSIDQGTTGTTVLILDRRLGLRAKVNQEYRQIFPRPGWVEHDLEDIWNSTAAMVKKALTQAGVKGKDLAAIGITNQRETVGMWSRKTGRPLHHAIVWQDRRTAERCDELRALGGEAVVRERTGLVIDSYFSATKYAWLFRHAGVPADAAVGTIDSWLIYRLTGGRAHVTDATNASRTLLYDIGRGRWDGEILDWLNIPENVLPEVLDSAAKFGETPVIEPGIADPPPPGK